ncbi:hypothetical protein FKM82_000557 [Ascaphus truei]
MSTKCLALENTITGHIQCAITQKVITVERLATENYKAVASDLTEQDDDGLSELYIHKHPNNKLGAALILKYKQRNFQLVYKSQNLKLQSIANGNSYNKSQLFILHKERNDYSFQCKANADLFLCVQGRRIKIDKPSQTVQHLFRINE